MKTQRELTKHSLKPKHRLKTQHINGNQTTKPENKVTNRQKQNKTKKPRQNSNMNHSQKSIGIINPGYKTHNHTTLQSEGQTLVIDF